jgi:hypothetical protein
MGREAGAHLVMGPGWGPPSEMELLVGEKWRVQLVAYMGLSVEGSLHEVVRVCEAHTPLWVAMTPEGQSQRLQTELKIAVSCRKASNCAPPMILNGAAGAGCRSACVSYRVAMVARSLDDVRGIATLEGENSNVSTILSAFILLMWTL